MSFTGRSDRPSGGVNDLTDVVGLISPFEVPLLDHLGDASRPASGTVHEWVEDTLLPNDAVINDSTRAVRLAAERAVTSGHRQDLMRYLQLRRTAGDDTSSTCGANRVYKANYTQMFAASVNVSDSHLADEVDYQKQERLRELLRDLENCVINGVAPASDQRGSTGYRRTLRGIIASLSTNVFVNGTDSFPAGDGILANELTDDQINAALSIIWDQYEGDIDTIVVNGTQKRRIITSCHVYDGYAGPSTHSRNLVNVYESEFGAHRVIPSRWVPVDTVLLLDSSLISVLPLAGHEFRYEKLSGTDDSEVGQVIGEYTLELRNQNAHGLIRGLATS